MMRFLPPHQHRQCSVRQVWLSCAVSSQYTAAHPLLQCQRQPRRPFSSLPSQSTVALSSFTLPISPLCPPPPPHLHLRLAHFISPPSPLPPDHQTLRDGLLTVKSIISDFVGGSKQLYHNALRSRALKRRLRADPSLILARADHRHLQRTRVDLMGGAVIVFAFGIPIVGNFIPLLAHFFPRQLPSVFVTQERQYELVLQDVKVGFPILLELQRHVDAVRPPEQSHAGNADTQTPHPSASTSPPPFRFVLSDVKREVELLEHVELFDALPLSSFNGHHLYRLLQHHSNLLVLHSILPSSVLQRHLHHWAQSIRHDDSLLLKEGRGQDLTVRELGEALHERGLFRGLLSPQYRRYIEKRVMRKRGQLKGKAADASPDALKEEEAADEAAAKAVLLVDLTGWLQMSEASGRAGRALPDSLLCHAGPVTFSDHYLTGVFAEPQPSPSSTSVS